MDNGLYTNGIMLGLKPELADQLLSPETGMVFVRVSINALSPKAVRAHWGVEDPNEVLVQLRGLEELFVAREKLAPRFAARDERIPSIQISTVIDHNNVDDLRTICETVADTFRRCCKTRGPEDVMIVRPIVIHRPTGFSDHDHEPKVIQHILQVCGKGGEGRVVLEEAGVPLFLGFGLDLVEAGIVPSYAELIRTEYRQRDVCWAQGLFLTVGPDGSVYPCMEMNCIPRWVLGNLKTQSVEEVYRSQRRVDFLEMASRSRWGPQLFHPHSRTARLDQIAKAIRQHALTDEDITAIRKQCKSSHALLLN
jgi:MoaA/NifB/PqqE/SkfB family radical SAM enzyme